MNKKQLKKLAKELADLEFTIQHDPDKNIVDNAKKKQIHLTDAADLELEEMVLLDGFIQKYLAEKNI